MSGCDPECSRRLRLETEALRARIAELEAACRTALRAGVGGVCIGGDCGVCPTCIVARAIREQVVRIDSKLGQRVEVLNASARAARRNK